MKKILKIDNFTPNLQNLTYVAIFWKISTKTSKYSLYISCLKRNFTLMSKLVLFLMCDKNSGFWSEICLIFDAYSYFFNILNKYITYVTPESRVFVAHQKKSFGNSIKFCFELDILRLYFHV